MRWILVVVVAWAALGGTARASSVGVVITGDDAMQARLGAIAARYIEQHGDNLVKGSLEPSAIGTLLDCLAIDDDACARSLVETRAHTDVVLAIRTDVTKTTTAREVRIVAFWIQKGHSPIAMRRVCEKCSDEALDSTFDSVLQDLVRNGATGRLILHSHPTGLLAILDSQAIGTTPLERDIPIGQHALALVQNGKTVAERWISIAADERAELDMGIDHKRRMLPAVVIGVGVAALIGGGVLYATSESPTGMHPTYRDTKPAGIATGIAGALAVGVGVFLLVGKF